MADSSASASTAVGPPKPSNYIVGPVYDSVFFILSPLIALVLGILIYKNHVSSMRVIIFDHEGSPSGIFIGAFTMAHLFIVFFRSNGNQKIFQLYPMRFTVVPIALFLAMCGSRWIAVSMGVLATWWDVYHSSLQTFGLGRIYDARKGNNAQVGRRLDFLLSLLLYAGPILAGASLMLHTRDFKDFEEVDSIFFSRLGERIDANQGFLTTGVLFIGVPFLVYYAYSYWRYYRLGYKFSVQKVVLLLATGFCSIYTWGFNRFGEAFFIMNFFHAFQYFGIVWWSEKKSMMSLFRFDRLKRAGKALTLAAFLSVAAVYGVWAETIDAETLGTRADIAFNAIIVVALMHFWYDGFIWSVRKKQI